MNILTFGSWQVWIYPKRIQFSSESFLFREKLNLKKTLKNQALWSIPVILALGRLRQEDHNFEASLSQNRTEQNKSVPWKCELE